DAYTGRVMFHAVPQDGREDAGPERDAVVFRQYTKEEDERLATTWGPGGHLSADGRWLLLHYFNDTRSNDLWLVDFEAYRRTGFMMRTEVSVGTPGTGFGSVVPGPDGDVLVLHTYKHAPRGRVVVAPVSWPSELGWRDLVPEPEDGSIEAVALAQGHVVVTYLERAVSRVVVYDLAGRRVGEAPLPAMGSAYVTTS